MPEALSIPPGSSPKPMRGQAPAAPRFSTEILRDDSGISIVGLVPEDTDRTGSVNRLKTIADSVDAKTALEQTLAQSAPPGLGLAMNIAAPRPAIAPFTPRFVLEPGGGRFDACSADSEAASDRILAVARGVVRVDRAACTVGMGVPSPRWADAATASMGLWRIWAEGRSLFWMQTSHWWPPRARRAPNSIARLANWKPHCHRSLPCTRSYP